MLPRDLGSPALRRGDPETSQCTVQAAARGSGVCGVLQGENICRFGLSANTI